MPYIEGASLRDWLTREPQLRLDQALQVTREGAEALELLEIPGLHPASANPVHDDMDRNPGAGPLGERFRELRPNVSGPIDENDQRRDDCDGDTHRAAPMARVGYQSNSRLVRWSHHYEA